MKKQSPSNPLVSVIIPTHNRLERLKSAIDSVLNQSYTNLELLVVDDGSEDGTAKYLDTVKDERFKFYINEKPKGANFARNIGLKNASGKYVALLDDDDEWFKNKLEIQMAELLKDENLVGVSCSYKIVDEINEGFKSEVKRDMTVDFEKLLNQNFVGSCSFFLFKKQEAVFFDESLNSCQDWDFYLQLTRKTDLSIKILPFFLVKYYVHSQQISGSGHKRIAGEKAFLTKYKKYLSLKNHYNFRYIYRGWMRESLIDVVGTERFVALRNIYRKTLKS